MVDWINFKKPQRYLDGEWNVVKKNPKGKIKVCLCYPSFYEVGMSNLGIRIVYALLNSFSDIVCERVFMPDTDYFSYLKSKKKKLCSLESSLPLKDFDVIGFNLSYELNYINVLAILDLGGVCVYASERKDIIVVGGGIANPESMADFIDVFILGEFEEIAEDFVEIMRRYKRKEERLKAFSEREGFYVPSFYNVYTKGVNYVVEKNYRYARYPLSRVYVSNLNNIFFPIKWLTPHTRIVHDRVQVEIARGCPNQCFFCQARCLYFPYRERKPQIVYDLIRKIYENSGYENFSLLALSASDYSSIEELITELTPYLNKHRIGISLPSLRVEDIVVGKLCTLLNKIKKVSVTFAIEAATESLRRRINKKVDINKIIEAANILRKLHYRHIKLYFMFGLPYEDYEDLKAIGVFVKNLRNDCHMNIHLSINIFVPKPFSYFENIEMEKESELLKKKKFILADILRIPGVKISISNVKKSILEAIISRGDRRLSSVIYSVFKKKIICGFYEERTDFKLWESSFKENNIDYYDYFIKRDVYSWSHTGSLKK